MACWMAVCVMRRSPSEKERGALGGHAFVVMNVAAAQRRAGLRQRPAQRLRQQGGICVQFGRLALRCRQLDAAVQ